MFTHPVMVELENQERSEWRRNLAAELRVARGPTLWDRLLAVRHTGRLAGHRFPGPVPAQLPARTPRIALAPGIHLTPHDVQPG